MTAPLTVPLAVFCAVENEITGAMCRRIRCDGAHDYDGLDDWATPARNERQEASA